MNRKMDVTLQVSKTTSVFLDVPDDLVPGTDEFDEFVTEHVYEEAYRQGSWDECIEETDWEEHV